MDISSLTSSATTTTSTAGTNSALSADFQTFLTMLTVQMQNQDPLNPVDSSDYAVQLATFSGVEQQVQTNTLLSEIQALFGTSGLVQMADWVGKEVRVAASAQYAGDPVTVTFSVPAIADQSEVIVQDQSGAEIARYAVSVTDESFDWDGTMSDGTAAAQGLYNFFVVSSSNGEVIEVEQAEIYAGVTEVQSQNGINTLILNGGVNVPADSVTAVRA